VFIIVNVIPVVKKLKMNNYANTQETVKLGFSLAIRNIYIKVKTGDIQKHYTAFALGPLYLNLQEA
jgi:hypothetical protein